jgi:hypothetical protein
VKGTVSPGNSLVGSQTNDQVGYAVKVLPSGHFVVSSFEWSDGATQHVGAVTWVSSAANCVGLVSAANSLIGSHANDQVGIVVTPLRDGNYVVGSFDWANGSLPNAGAVTWRNGSLPSTGVVSSTNSLVGTQHNDEIGAGAFGLGGVVALSNGNYVVASPQWGNGVLTQTGSVTWGSGGIGITGVVSSANSLVGSHSGDRVGSGAGFFTFNNVTALGNGDYVVFSPNWANGAAAGAGAVSLGAGSFGTHGPVSAANSVLGAAPDVGASLTWTYDYVHAQLVVGRPADNVVTLLKTVTYQVSMPIVLR